MQKTWQSMQLFLAVAVLAVLSGCGTLKDDLFSNRLVTTVNCEEAMIVSKWGPFAFSSKVDPKDMAALPCRTDQAVNAAVGAALQAAKDSDRVVKP